MAGGSRGWTGPLQPEAGKETDGVEGVGMNGKEESKSIVMMTGRIGRNQIGRNQKQIAYATGKVTSVGDLQAHCVLPQAMKPVLQSIWH